MNLAGVRTVAPVTLLVQILHYLKVCAAVFAYFRDSLATRCVTTFSATVFAFVGAIGCARLRHKHSAAMPAGLGLTVPSALRGDPYPIGMVVHLKLVVLAVVSEYHQVFGTVIVFDSVDVVNYFLWKKIASKFIFGNKTVFGYMLFAVTVGMIRTLYTNITLHCFVPNTGLLGRGIYRHP